MSSSDSAKILNFLNGENRPYGLNDVIEKCGENLSKSTVQKILNTLLEKEKISVKEIGKQKIYYIKQNYESGELKRELQFYNQKLAHAHQCVKSRQTQFQHLDAKLKAAASVRSVDTLQREREKLTKEISEMNEKLSKRVQQATTATYTPTAVQKIEKNYDVVVKAYRHRKRMCSDMIEAIAEHYPKTKKALLEDIGVETDDAAGFKLEIPR